MQLVTTARRPQPNGRVIAHSASQKHTPLIRASEPTKPEPINPWIPIGDATARILAQIEEVRR
jgi:hypothetical protein